MRLSARDLSSCRSASVLGVAVSFVVACVGGSGTSTAGRGEGEGTTTPTGTAQREPGSQSSATEPSGEPSGEPSTPPSSGTTLHCYRNLPSSNIPGCFCTHRDLTADDATYADLEVDTCGPEASGSVCCAEGGWPDASAASCACAPRECRQSATGTQCGCGPSGSVFLGTLPRVVSSCPTSSAVCCRDAAAGVCMCTRTNGGGGACPSGQIKTATCDDLGAYCADQAAGSTNAASCR